MTPRRFFESHSREEVAKLASDAGTTYANFQQIAMFGGAVGKNLAERLAVASGGLMTELEILYPERYEGAGGGPSVTRRDKSGRRAVGH